MQEAAPGATTSGSEAAPPPTTSGPPVLIVGGFLTSPFLYRRMRQRLLARGAASVAIAPIWTPDWLAAMLVGYRRLTGRTANAIRRAHATAGGVPLLVIGHSGGGVLARLAMAPRQSAAAAADVAPRVGALVTLGSPGRIFDQVPHPPSVDAFRFLERTTPGAFFAPRTGYVTVASRYMEGRGRWWDLRRWSVGLLYAIFVGHRGRRGWGDSLIPVDASHLDGAEQITLEGIAHGQAIASWYGDDRGLDGWWDAAVAAWRMALAARASERAEPPT
ncbi:MAG TPA: hypothetical protein VFK38_09630 [Candidatus Limnocylindrales bacterium]|nr:hypothetical protein [Candidatus Limnocylindrales bacterium]